MLNYAELKVKEIFGIEGGGSLLYKKIQDQIPDVPGWDFIEFRQTYKSVLYNLIRNQHNIKALGKQMDLDALLDNNYKIWAPKLWHDTKSSADDFKEEIREGLYTCSRCLRKGVYAKNTEHEEKQTRSADEGATVYITCLTCLHKWKGSF